MPTQATANSKNLTEEDSSPELDRQNQKNNNRPTGTTHPLNDHTTGNKAEQRGLAGSGGLVAVWRRR
jgi:hypothetical protein